MTGARKRRLPARVLLLACILGAVGGIRLPAIGEAPPPIAVMDASASVGTGPLVPPPGARVDGSWIAVGETVRVVEGLAAAPGVPRDGTLLATALRRLAATFPGRDAWVFTDGRATESGVEEAARRVAAGGGRVHVSAPRTPAADIALLEVRVAPQAVGGRRFVATVAASTAGQARILLLRDEAVVDRFLLDLETGTRQEVELRDTADARGVGLSYRIRVEPMPGTPNDDDRNDELALGVPPSRRAVLIWGPLPPTAFEGAGEVAVTRLGAFDSGRLAAADGVVLADVPWEWIGPARAAALERFVAGGGRLLLLGGPASWGAGGWAGTPLEERLAALRSPRPDGPGLALVLALDRSGSTARGALQHLSDAARRAVGGLAPGERVGVLPFAAAPDLELLAPGWISSATEAPARERLVAALDALTPGGGTDLVAAVLAAARRTKDLEARSRRVLLLTDGDPDAPPSDAELLDLRSRLDALGVEFGALVSGSPVMAARLRLHLAADPSDVVALGEAASIPARLAHELGRARGEREHRRAPAAIGWDESPPGDLAALLPSWMHGLEVWPGAQLRAEARGTDEDPGSRPFAASRLVGAGEVWSLAWGPGAEADPVGACAVLRPLVVALANAADRGLAARWTASGLEVSAPDLVGRGRLDIVGRGEPATLIEEGPGLFRGPGPLPGEGGSLRAVVPGPDGRFFERALRLPARPAAEHRGAGVDEDALQALARAGGGVRLAAGAVPPAGAKRQGMSLRPWLLLLALILLLLERSGRGEAPAASRFTEGEDPS